MCSRCTVARSVVTDGAEQCSAVVHCQSVSSFISRVLSGESHCQRSALSTQHSALSTQHSALSTRLGTRLPAATPSISQLPAPSSQLPTPSSQLTTHSSQLPVHSHNTYFQLSYVLRLPSSVPIRPLPSGFFLTVYVDARGTFVLCVVAVVVVRFCAFTLFD